MSRIFFTQNQSARTACNARNALKTMSFFGCTALGPKNTFQASRLGQPTLHLFLEDDLKKAFDAVAAKTEDDANQSISFDAVSKVLDLMFESTAPVQDVQLLTSELERIGHRDSISWNNLLYCFKKVVEKIESKLDDVMGETDSSYFGSHSSYRDAMRRHKRTADGPDKLLSKPLTASQEYGWFGGNGKDTHSSSQTVNLMGKKSCAETIYQSELIKSGVLL